MNNFLDLADLSREQVVELLALAERLQTRPEPQALAGKTAAAQRDKDGNPRKDVGAGKVEGQKRKKFLGIF